MSGPSVRVPLTMRPRELKLAEKQDEACSHSSSSCFIPRLQNAAYSDVERVHQPGAQRVSSGSSVFSHNPKTC